MTTLGLLIGSLPLARTQRHLTRLLIDAAPEGVTVVELDPRSLPQHAPYADVPAPADALAWKRSLAEIDGLVVITPTIERSIPGALKNAIDWAGGATAPNALKGMPTAIAGVSLGSLPRFASIQHLRTVLTDDGAVLRAQPEVVLFAAPETFAEDGTPLDEDLVVEARRLMSAAAGVAAHQRRAREAATGETPVSPVTSAATPTTTPVPAHASPVTTDPAVLNAETMPIDTIDPVTEVLRAAPGPVSPSVGVPTR
ncbi:NADPH-dependent FMN reductase [Demequina sp. NBRC 110055]|uniref:NADPH-dependent FMN reductase n=1 Tax=Demequina sp. NBRC 110055 TaxID=1570344 RepID=UPI001356376D|nr:NAD(P)H-dependent oxidoreductase [Demequina sp. NBRC 110055]